MILQKGPQTRFSDNLHAQKYRSEGETFEDSMYRIANALKDDTNHFNALKNILLDMRFMPGGRVQAGAGSPKVVTLVNCFVSGTIEDSFVDGEGSIMQRATEAAQTMRMGGGIGFDFSTLRPKGDMIKGVHSVTDGPLAFLPIFDSICRATSSSGNRRGALMGVLRIDHPDIEAFIRVKQQLGVLEGFNLSVGVTDEFMHALETNTPFTLRFGGREYSKINPNALWDTLMRSTWDWGDPGVLFIDTINQANNLKHLEIIAASNPCGEQILPPYGACVLGSFNLVKYLRKFENKFYLDIRQLSNDIPHVVRAMDNIIDRSLYPLEQQRQESINKRRIGIGITGLANCIETLGHSYGSPEFLREQGKIMSLLRDRVYLASAMLAREKGTFPLYDERYLAENTFQSSVSNYARSAIERYGLRNSHLLSVAPTGTISLCADNVSSGIEPVFSYEAKRLINTPGGQISVNLKDYAYSMFGTKGKLAADVSPQEHIDVLATASKYVDSAVSKTVNVDKSIQWEDFKNLYVQAWKAGCKGCTTFNSDGKKMGILLGKSEDKPWTCEIDPLTGQKECG